MDELSTRDHPDWWKPIGGQNSQDSILERRSLVWNDNEVVAPDAPPANYEEVDHKGKFYPRGCRGMIEQLLIYCIRTAAGNLTLRLSPHPCLGPLYEVTITPGATWAWVAADLEIMWNYDSLFIWVHTCAADVSWGYDTDPPFDGHWSQDAGATWEDMAIRPFIRVVYTGETPGDVPVSGIVNTIPIPNSSQEASTAIRLGTVSGVYSFMNLAEGAGTLTQVEVRFTSVVVPAAGVEYRVRIQADGLPGITIGNQQLTQSVVATAGRCALGEFLQTATVTYLWVRLPLQFRRELQIESYHSTGAPVNVQSIIVTNELV